VVVLGYGVTFYFLSLTLDSIPVGVSYALWSGIGIVFISLIGWRFFNQSLDAPAIIGIALIVVGVAVINFAVEIGIALIFSKSATHVYKGRRIYEALRIQPQQSDKSI